MDKNLSIPATEQTIPHGIWGAVLLPISNSGTIDWIALAEEVNILCASDLHGIYTNGTAGEFHNQTEAEFYKITEIVSSIAKSTGKAFQIGVSNTNPRIMRERLRNVIALAPTGVQFILPDWWFPSPAESNNFMTGMQDSAEDIPLILYHPPHAKTQLTLTQIAALRNAAPGLVGAKLAGGDENWYKKRRELLPGFSIFVAGHKLAFGHPLGANGSYSNVACLSPNGAVKHWYQMQQNPVAAAELELRINTFLATHIMPLAEQHGLSSTALDKLLAATGGWGPVSAKLLWPYSCATGEDVRRVAQAARVQLPELF